jgi:hypothetical protein
MYRQDESCNREPAGRRKDAAARSAYRHSLRAALARSSSGFTRIQRSPSLWNQTE